MNKPLFSFHSLVILVVLVFTSFDLVEAQTNVLEKDYIINLMTKVNQYQLEKNVTDVNRKWKQATYYTGVMAFYKATGDAGLFNQALRWAEKNNWKVGNEMFFPANRLICTQTYLEIFFIRKDSSMINETKDYLDTELVVTEPAYVRGWYYVDALFVGIPSFLMMTAATGEKKYSDYGNRIFWELADQLYDRDEALFYRDSEARFNGKSKNGKKVLWSRGNGWVMASLPRIITYLENDNTYYSQYVELLKEMAAGLIQRQGEDGLWRTNLADTEEYPEPESSGTAFFVYAIAWGINNGILSPEEFKPLVNKAWMGLSNIVDDNGKVCWGQPEARKPGKVSKEDSDEFVTGAFLLAGSEMLQLIEKSKQE
jgi:unsaturated rhamnogalacturonyl hydrolase